MPDFHKIEEHLIALYGSGQGQWAFEQLKALPRFQEGIDRHGSTQSARGSVDQRDAMLITYGDQVQLSGKPPLRVLSDFCNEHLAGLINGIHILPFYPYSSDDGFSVIDYRQVDPALGDWEDIRRLAGPDPARGSGHDGFRLMFDAVINHVSVQSRWFHQFLQGDPHFSQFFITVEGSPDLSQVVRPRALPLLTSFETVEGSQAVWTTFSADQVDLNYQNPRVLLEILDILLVYASQGAEFIRLDAVGYLWKEIGASCIHLPQTHRVIQLIRAVLDLAAPQVLLITETNVPHADNIRYFGDGYNEAQLVYNFALPPLVLHTLRTGSAGALSDWAAGLRAPSPAVTFFNFLASHDGIGINPVRGILKEAEIDALVEGALEHGGLVSYKNNPDGTQSPYELNINYFDALSNPRGREPVEIQVRRFLAAQWIMLTLAGVPGIYFHSLFGSRGWPEGVRQTGMNRTINREKLQLDSLQEALQNPSSLRAQVFSRYAHLLHVRAAQAAFHPSAPQRILNLGERVFGLIRSVDEDSPALLCLLNVTDAPQIVQADWPQAGLSSTVGAVDLLAGGAETMSRGTAIHLAPYQYRWLALNHSRGATG